MTLANKLKNKIGEVKEYIGWFPVCVTLKPELFKYCCARQLKYTIDKLCGFSRLFCGNIMCVAELTAKCNIHYHMLVKWSELNQYSRQLFEDTIKTHSMFGNIMISKMLSTVAEATRYIDYLLKEVDKTDSIVNGVRKNKLKIYRICKKKSLVTIYNKPCLESLARLNDHLDAEATDIPAISSGNITTLGIPDSVDLNGRS